MLARESSQPPIRLDLPEHAFERAEEKDPRLAEEIIENLSAQYHPLEAIKGLKIVL